MAGGSPYRGLKVFWGIVGVVVIGGSVTLQVLGPPPHGGPAPQDESESPEPPPAPKPAAPTKADIASPDATLQEPAPDIAGRALPRRAGDRAPRQVYAASFDANDKHPRIAIVLDGAGLDQDQTLHLLNDLPGAVDVAFSAYMPEAIEDQMAQLARQTGHECWLSVPMEPSFYPLSEEGPRALLTGSDPEQNRQNLEWALSRLPGCVGATGASDGMAGERYAQTGQGLGFAEVLKEVDKRGLLYLDPRTGAPALASASPDTYRVVDMVIDLAPNPQQPVTAELIDQRLAELEHLAAVHGSAIGLAGPPRPVLLERIAVWAHGLAARGITLAPVTAIAAPPGPANQDEQ